jgi:hypothetical protein
LCVARWANSPGSGHLWAEPALECGSGAAAFSLVLHVSPVVWRVAWQKAEAALRDVIHQHRQPDHVAVLLAKAVAALPHSKARAFGPRREPVARVEKDERMEFSNSQAGLKRFGPVSSF